MSPLRIVLRYLRICYNFIVLKIFKCIYKKQDFAPYLPPVKHEFLEYSALKLANKIRKRELSSEEVVKGFIDRIKEVQPLINALASERFDAAMQEAKVVDEYLRNNSPSDEELKSKPFLGVPFTTKESTECEGLNYSLGIWYRAGVKGTSDSEMVRLIKQAGAILIANTNIPELNLWIESRNLVYGQTNNPYNQSRGAGGSSGGEASLLSASGTPLSLGTDIGGSIRCPALNCGVYGVKATCGTINMRGATKRTGKETNTMVTAGPLTRHAEDILPILKIMSNSNPTLTFDSVDLKKLNIYFMEESNEIRTNPVSDEMKKVLRKAVLHCQELSGKQAKKLNLEGFQYSYKLWRYWMSREYTKFALELGNCEWEVKAVPELIKKLFGLSNHTFAVIIRLFDSTFMPKENAKWAEETTEKLRHELLDKLGNDGVFIYPSCTDNAPYHHMPFTRPYEFSYFGIFNVLKLPVIQVPCGLDSSGLPLGVQVVAAPYHEHLCASVAQELEKSLGGWVPPYTKVKN